jgi:hypothetical protein
VVADKESRGLSYCVCCDMAGHEDMWELVYLKGFENRRAHMLRS